MNKRLRQIRNAALLTLAVSSIGTCTSKLGEIIKGTEVGVNGAYEGRSSAVSEDIPGTDGYSRGVRTFIGKCPEDESFFGYTPMAMMGVDKDKNGVAETILVYGPTDLVPMVFSPGKDYDFVRLDFPNQVIDIATQQEQADGLDNKVNRYLDGRITQHYGDRRDVLFEVGGETPQTLAEQVIENRLAYQDTIGMCQEVLGFEYSTQK